MNPIIVVPTDYSENALLAARFAAGLADKIGADICLLHAYSWLLSGFQTEQEQEQHRVDAEQQAQTEMENFLGRLEGDEKSYRSVIIPGHLNDALDKIMSESNVALVVMGTTGATGLRHHVLGSNTFATAKHLRKIPLVVVPPATSRFSLDKIAFFTDFQQGDLQTITALKGVFPDLGAKLKFVHIGKNSEASEEKVKLESWSKTLAEQTGYSAFPTQWVSGEEGIDTIRKMDEKFDLLVVTAVERGFFEKILNKSLAKELIHQSDIPVLIYQGNGGSDE